MKMFKISEDLCMFGACRTSLCEVAGKNRESDMENNSATCRDYNAVMCCGSMCGTGPDPFARALGVRRDATATGYCRWSG